jgi:hypothetical protein
MYIVIQSPVDSNTSVFFFDEHEKAIGKFFELINYGETRLYCVFGASVERHFPGDGTLEDVQLGKEEVL